MHLLAAPATDLPVQLHASYEDARDAVVDGRAVRLLVANAYSAINRFYMDDRLDLEQAFVMDTPDYGLATRPDRPLPVTCRVATHPAPRDLIAQLIPPGYRIGEIDLVSSTSVAAEEVVSRHTDLALTTVPAARMHGLTFISRARPIRMLWSVFTHRGRHHSATVATR